MNFVKALIHYGGEWNESNCYSNYKVAGVHIPENCSLFDLGNLIKNEINTTWDNVEISYQVTKSEPPIKMLTNNSVLFYIDLKKSCNSILELPLCIEECYYTSFQNTVTNHELIQTHYQHSEKNQAAIHNMGIGSLVLQARTIIESEIFEDGTSSNHNSRRLADYTNEVADFIIEETTRNKRKREEDKTIIETHKLQTLVEGQLFKDKKMFKSGLCYYAMINNFQFRTKRSEPREYVVTCVDENCKWYVRASTFKHTDYFKVRKYVKEHTCSLEVIMEDHRQANCNVIGELIKTKFTTIKRVHTPNDIMKDMLDDYGVSMSYSKAWRSREKAIELVRGKTDESYQQLPMYLHMLKVANPGTITSLTTDDKDRFKYLYLAYAHSIKGWQHCRPIIVVDGTFMKSSYRGTLFTASTMDASNNIFPLAFGVGDSENDEAWEYFFTKLKETYGERKDLVIISDRHQSIENAVQTVYPNVFHGACIFHLLNNIKANLHIHGDDLTINFVKAAKAYTLVGFEYYMAALDKIDARIRPYLEKVGYHTWARSHSPKRRYTMMTSNIAESINAANKAARNLPITLMLECIRSVVQKWVWTNGNEANGTFTAISSEAEAVLRENYLKSTKFEVRQCNTIFSEVIEERGTYIVNIQEKTCTCRRFQEDEVPCSHALAVIAKKRLNCYEFCSAYYKTETMKATYAETVYPLPHEDEWSLPEELDILVLPPKGKIPPGRPRRRRIRARGEPRVVMKCGRCGKSGHNRKTCRNPPMEKPHKPRE
ncbi:hypothetical protein CsatB_005691 [Cannabis sativa]|uniref:uncharacterized protein LOC115696795 n=1 Tax=Cannabis sativa TaxID=3483 RepID=UPI0029CA396D|nr:uncharacterized protein LOC115696795 [Cannabis sativa]